MSACRTIATIVVLLLSIFSSAKTSRKPFSETAPVKLTDEASIPEVKTNSIQKSFFIAMSYSLFSPTFDTEALKSQNQESLGVSAALGYSYAPYSGWGLQATLGVLQHSKTDRSLPDFVLLKPAVGLLFSLSNEIYVMGGAFNYTQQGDSVKHFQSYIGQEVFVGYKANKQINIKFGFSNSKFSGDFQEGSDTINSVVSIRGLESQLVYLF